MDEVGSAPHTNYGSGSAAGRNVFVRHLPPTLNERGLLGLFAPYGHVLSSKVMREHGNNNSLGYGFVMYARAEDAEAAIAEMHGYPLGGKLLQVEAARKHVVLPTDTNATHASERVYIARLPERCTNEALGALLAPFGAVAESRVLVDKSTGRTRQCALVRMGNKDEAARVVSTLHGAVLKGTAHPLVVRFADTVEQREERRKRNKEKDKPLHPARGPPNKYSHLWKHFEHDPATGIPQRVIHPDTLEQVDVPPAVEVPRNYDPSQPGFDVFVFHLPPTVDDAQLYALFSPHATHGRIESVRVMIDRVRGCSKGFGFVRFSEPADALAAIDALHGSPLGSKVLHVAPKRKNDAPRTTAATVTATATATATATP